MSQLTDNLSAIAAIKSDIRAAIESKGVSMSGVSFGSYAAKIGEIETGFVTESLNVTDNGTYTPGQGVDGYSQVTVNVPQSVTGFTQKEITEGVQITDLNNSAVSVYKYALAGNTYLRTVNLPNCKEVGADGFLYCFSLSTVNLPECKVLGELAFSNCTSLLQVSLPECLSIISSCFMGCSSLQSIILPKCTYIGGSAFVNCRSLSVADIPECLMLSESTFANCSRLAQVNMPNVSIVGYAAFSNCSSLVSADIPKCSNIGNYAFRDCRSLTTLNAPVCVSVGASAFYNCPLLENINLEHVTFLNTTFAGNSHISEISLPCLSALTGNLFNNCSNLTSLTLCTGTYTIPSYNLALTNTPFASGTGSIYIDAGMYDKWVTASGWSAFSSLFVSVGNTNPMLSFSDGVVYGKTRILNTGYSSYLNLQGSSVSMISLPDCEVVNLAACSGQRSITSVSLPSCSVVWNDAFKDCFSLSDVYLPEVVILGGRAFMSCSVLTSINLPKCERIYSGAFSECHKLSVINLPVCEHIGNQAFMGTMQDITEGVSLNLPVCSYIGDQAFSWATKLSWITLGLSSVCILGKNVFTASVQSIYVPASLVDAYKSADNWSQYSSKIFPIE